MSSFKSDIAKAELAMKFDTSRTRQQKSYYCV